MASITTREYPITPTMRWVDSEGRLTGEGFRLMKAVAELVEAVTIEDGEITADMISVTSLEAISATLGNVVIDGDLVVNGTITTGKIALQAVTEITIALQGGGVGPSGALVLSADVPVTDTGTTGVLIQFAGFMDKPVFDAANFGYWSIQLYKNGSPIDGTPGLFYDDNFSYQPVAFWVDESPGTDPEYEIYTVLGSGPGDFTLTDSVGIFSLFKR